MCENKLDKKLAIIYDAVKARLDDLECDLNEYYELNERTDKDCCSVGGSYEYEIKDTEIRLTEVRYILSLFNDQV